MTNKTYHLTSNKFSLDLTLTPPNQRGYCFKCHLTKKIWVISEKYYPYEERKFCRGCALTNLYELEEDYEFENKKAVIKELRAALSALLTANQKSATELLECYE